MNLDLDELKEFASGRDAPGLAWSSVLSSEERNAFRGDLNLIFTEPALYDEPIDMAELLGILEEFAEIAKWHGPLASWSTQSKAEYIVEARAKDLKVLKLAAPAVQRAANRLINEILPNCPANPPGGVGLIKKIPDRDIIQIGLPDGYRLRYHIEEDNKMVHVVYLGPHPDGAEDGREKTILAAIQRRKNERL